MNKISFEINNNRIMELAQPEHDGKIIFGTYDDRSRKVDCEVEIPAGDFVMLMNSFRKYMECGIWLDWEVKSKTTYEKQEVRKDV